MKRGLLILLSITALVFISFFYASQEYVEDDASIPDIDSVADIEGTFWEQRIAAALEPVSCPPVEEIQYPSSYYQGPFIDSHFHIGSLSDQPPGDPLELPEYAWLGESITIDEIACTLKHDGIIAAFSFFNVWEDIEIPSIAVTKEIMDRYPDLFVPFIQPPDDPTPVVRASALKEMLSVFPGLFDGLGEIGFYGKYGPVNDPPPDAPVYLENYKLAEEHNLMVYYHLGRGHAEQFKQVIADHPNINFIFHGDTVTGDGSTLVGVLTDIIASNKNVFYTIDELYGDEWLLQTGVSKQEFLAHFEDYEPLIQKDLDTWKEAIQAYPDQFMWGTDRGDEPLWTYDREVGEQLIDYSRAFIGRLDPEVQERFAYKNAQKLLNR